MFGLGELDTAMRGTLINNILVGFVRLHRRGLENVDLSANVLIIPGSVAAN